MVFFFVVLAILFAVIVYLYVTPFARVNTSISEVTQDEFESTSLGLIEQAALFHPYEGMKHK